MKLPVGPDHHFIDAAREWQLALAEQLAPHKAYLAERDGYIGRHHLRNRIKPRPRSSGRG